MKNGEFVQIGVTAMRTPTGDFLPSVPLYIKTTDAIKSNGLTASEVAVLRDVAAVIADAKTDHVEVR